MHYFADFSLTKEEVHLAERWTVRLTAVKVVRHFYAYGIDGEDEARDVLLTCRREVQMDGSLKVYWVHHHPSSL